MMLLKKVIVLLGLLLIIGLPAGYAEAVPRVAVIPFDTFWRCINYA